MNRLDALLLLALLLPTVIVTILHTPGMWFLLPVVSWYVVPAAVEPKYQIPNSIVNTE